MGVRTIFNILGPLTNPAGAPNILMGVFHPDLVGIQVRVMQRLGADHVLVVWGKDGMDEISLGAATLVGELKDGKVREYEIHPEDFGGGARLPCPHGQAHQRWRGRGHCGDQEGQSEQGGDSPRFLARRHCAKLSTRRRNLSLGAHRCGLFPRLR
jgi:hypothetical protein